MSERTGVALSVPSAIRAVTGSPLLWLTDRAGFVPLRSTRAAAVAVAAAVHVVVSLIVQLAHVAADHDELLRIRRRPWLRRWRVG